MPFKNKKENRIKRIVPAEAMSLCFGGVAEENFEKAKVVFIPVGYDATTSYRPGARDGPMAILQASVMLEEIWGGEWGNDIWHPMVTDQFFYTMGPYVMPIGSSTEEHLASVAEFIAPIVDEGKIPFLLGGEHSLTFSAIKVLHRKYKEFSILHFDAHPDLRDTYAGDPYSHACVMRRSWELGPKVSLTSVGIRSVDRGVQKYIEEKTAKNTAEKFLHIFYAPEVPVKKIDATLKENVYITFDLDAFDPSFMPAVGTPQPGGLEWYSVIGLLERVIKNHNIIGMDVVELAPIPGMIAPDFSAAKLVWKMVEILYERATK